MTECGWEDVMWRGGGSDVETFELSLPRQERARCTKSKSKSTLVKGKGEGRSLRQK